MLFSRDPQHLTLPDLALPYSSLGSLLAPSELNMKKYIRVGNAQALAIQPASLFCLLTYRTMASQSNAIRERQYDL